VQHVHDIVGRNLTVTVARTRRVTVNERVSPYALQHRKVGQ
jgi:hypothetical protein